MVDAPATHRALAAALDLLAPLAVLVTMSPSGRAGTGARPDVGIPGSLVTATATGLTRCLPDVPEDVEPGAHIEPTPASVTFRLGRHRCDLPAGDGRGCLRDVPGPGRGSTADHTIAARCDQDPDLRLTLPLTVVSPEPTSVPVPNLVGGVSPQSSRAPRGLQTRERHGQRGVVQRRTRPLLTRSRSARSQTGRSATGAVCGDSTWRPDSPA
jgi:hypothetical protein